MNKIIYDKTYYNVAVSYCWKELFFVLQIYKILIQFIIFKRKPKRFYKTIFFIFLFNFKPKFIKSFKIMPLQTLTIGFNSFYYGFKHTLTNKVSTYNGSFPNFMYKCGVVFALPIILIQNPKLFSKELTFGFLNKFAFLTKFKYC